MVTRDTEVIQTLGNHLRSKRAARKAAPKPATNSEQQRATQQAQRHARKALEQFSAALF
jgi:hypothetical protein